MSETLPLGEVLTKQLETMTKLDGRKLIFPTDNKFLIALKILSLPNFKLRDFDCDTNSQAIAWLKSLDLRDIRDIYSDMNQAWQELR